MSGLLDVEPVDSGGTLVGFDPLHALCRFCLVSAASNRPPVPALGFADPVSGCSRGGPLASVADEIAHGFTMCFAHPLGFRQHLTHGL